MIELFINSAMGQNRLNAEIIRRSGMFKSFGDRCYWHSVWIPSYPELISIGDNVSVAANVRMYEHDLVRCIWG